MLSKLINIHKIKFSILENILADYNKKNKVINIHIDLHTILSSLYKLENYNETNWFKNSTVIISSCILNIAAHYRLFFHSRYGISTRIFLYYTNTRPRNNTEYCPEYGYRFFDKYSIKNEKFKPVNMEVSNNLKLVKTIAEYIPDLYYIDCRNIEPLIAIGYLSIKYPQNNIVITKDELLYQLVNLSKTKILKSKRDESYIISKDNVYEVLIGKSSYVPEHISPELLSVIYSFSGIKSRDVKGLKGYGYAKTIKILDLAIKKELIPNTHTHIKNILDEIYTGKDKELLINNFKAIDLHYQSNELTLAQKELINGYLTTKYNKKDLLALNNIHYTGDNSIMLEELYRGTDKLDTFKW